ncbi:hypothetical protein DUNSADRAFT_14029 [Dunaliella salina]|uniref:Uncharacterized protein n=1 Tax=Dunaliella salina TaxID=3046 RepID=A0ABQ7H2Z6_DUNSA|nr:hypothetical protein DUNSADRAFT_14029 [Dunaliella salina]|eukprot:KAF5841198.1 hypothetical protein DUNSADRAFT_14029 [Dunaliella salina]
MESFRNLGHQGLNDADACALSKELASNKSLTSLDLRGNLIGDAGAAALEQAIRFENTTLVDIKISDNPCCASCPSIVANILRLAQRNATLNASKTPRTTRTTRTRATPTSMSSLASTSSTDSSSSRASGLMPPLAPRAPSAASQAHLPAPAPTPALSSAAPAAASRTHLPAPSPTPALSSAAPTAPPHAAPGDIGHAALPCPLAEKAAHQEAVAEEAFAAEPCSHTAAQPAQPPLQHQHYQQPLQQHLQQKQQLQPQRQQPQQQQDQHQPQQQQQQQPHQQAVSTVDQRLQRLEAMGGLAASQISELQRLLSALDTSINGSDSSSKGVSGAGATSPAAKQEQRLQQIEAVLASKAEQDATEQRLQRLEDAAADALSGLLEIRQLAASISHRQMNHIHEVAEQMSAAAAERAALQQRMDLMEQQHDPSLCKDLEARMTALEQSTAKKSHAQQHSSNGDERTRQTQGHVQQRSGNGDEHMRQAHGHAQQRSNNGDQHMRQAHGHAQQRSNNGDQHMRQTHGHGQQRSSNGDKHTRQTQGHSEQHSGGGNEHTCHASYGEPGHEGSWSDAGVQRSSPAPQAPQGHHPRHARHLSCMCSLSPPPSNPCAIHEESSSPESVQSGRTTVVHGQTKRSSLSNLSPAAPSSKHRPHSSLVWYKNIVAAGMAVSFNSVPENGASHADTNTGAEAAGRRTVGEGNRINNEDHQSPVEGHPFNGGEQHLDSEDCRISGEVQKCFDGEGHNSEELQLSCAVSDGPSEGTSDSHPSPLDICRYRSRPHQTPPQQQQQRKPTLKSTQMHHQLLGSSSNNTMHDSSTSLLGPRQHSWQQQQQLVLGRPRREHRTDAGDRCGATLLDNSICRQHLQTAAFSDCSNLGTTMDDGSAGVIEIAAQQQQRQQGKGSSSSISMHPQRSSIDVAHLLHNYSMQAGCCSSWDGAREEHGENSHGMDNDEGDDAQRVLDQVCPSVAPEGCSKSYGAKAKQHRGTQLMGLHKNCVAQPS